MQSIQDEIGERKKSKFSFFLLCQKQRTKNRYQGTISKLAHQSNPKKNEQRRFQDWLPPVIMVSQVSWFRIGPLQLLGSQLVISNPDYVLNQKDGMSCTTVIFHFYQSVGALYCDYSQSFIHILGTYKWFLRNKHSMYQSIQEPVLSLSRFDLSQATSLPTQ